MLGARQSGGAGFFRVGIVRAVWGDWGFSWFYDGARQGIELFQYIINCGFVGPGISLWRLEFSSRGFLRGRRESHRLR